VAVRPRLARRTDEGGRKTDEGGGGNTTVTDFGRMNAEGRIVRLSSALPKTTEARGLGEQVLRSGTFVGARPRSTPGTIDGRVG
jgi:hypothetical protein